MNLLFFTSDIHFMGGGERVTSYMASWYADKGNDVTILSMNSFKPNSLYSLHYKVKLEYLNIPNTRYTSKLKVYFAYKKYIKKTDYDIVIGIGTYASCIIGLGCSCGKSIGCEHNSFDAAPQCWCMLRKIAYKRLNAVVVLTSTDLPKVHAINRNSYVIPNSVPIQTQFSDLSHKKILAVGKIYKQKGFDRMIRIFNKFANKIEDWTLEIVGDGEDKESVKTLIELYGLNSRVFISEPTSKMRDKYLNSSIYLMTSRYEGLPMVLLEAQSFGLPIISYDILTGPSDVIEHGISGFLIKDDDENAMAVALEMVCKDDSLRVKMGIEAQKRALLFSPDSIFEKWDSLFSKLL